MFAQARLVKGAFAAAIMNLKQWLPGYFKSKQEKRVEVGNVLSGNERKPEAVMKDTD